MIYIIESSHSGMHIVVKRKRSISAAREWIKGRFNERYMYQIYQMPPKWRPPSPSLTNRLINNHFQSFQQSISSDHILCNYVCLHGKDISIQTDDEMMVDEVMSG